MSIKLIVSTLVALAVVGGGTYYVVNNDDGNNSEKTDTVAQTDQETATTENASLNELIVAGINKECSFSYNSDGGDRTAGTFYVSDDRLRGDFYHTPKSEEQTKYGMIRDSEYVYTWDKAAAEGFKIKTDAIKPDSNGEKEQEEQSDQAIDQDKKYDFECDDWSVDESVFKKPTDVKFTDLSDQLEKIQETKKEFSDELENACAQIADPEVRAACEKNL